MTFMRKKSVQLAMILILAVGIILTGTFAWFSFTQNAINIFDGFTNPDVNLHDDFWEPNKDVYVENSGQQPLYLRVRLDEWMEIGGKIVETRQGKLPFIGLDEKPGWLTHSYLGSAYDNCGEVYHENYQWIMGDNELDPDVGDKYYLPAPFSTRALFDANGLTVKEPGVVTNVPDNKGVASSTLYGTEETYTAAKNVLMDVAYKNLDTALKAMDADDPTKTVKEVVDALYLALDEAMANPDPIPADIKAAQDALTAYLEAPVHGLGYYDKVSVVKDDGTLWPDGDAKNPATIKWIPMERTLKTEKIYTMAQWIAAGTPTGDFWIMDNDGWVYWGNIVMPGQATGLLLSEVNLSTETPPAGKWSYKINSSLQAVTFSDIAKFADLSENGGGGITEEGTMVLQAVSGDYAFDWSNLAITDKDPVYTFKNYKNNVYALMTTSGTDVTYGDRFIYTGPLPATVRGDLYQGDATYKKDQTFNKNTTSLIGTGNTDTEFTIVGETLVEGANSDWYLQLTYTGLNTVQPASDCYLAVGANRKFDKITDVAGVMRSDGDDLLVWVAKDTKPGGADDRRVEAATKAGHKVGDEIVVDNTDFVVIGKENREGNPNKGKSLIISKNILDKNIATADIATTLEGYANAGTGSLTTLVAADNAAKAQLLSIQDALDYFVNNAARMATDTDAVAGKWWMADDAAIGVNGSFVTPPAPTATDVGVRVAIWVNTEKLEPIIEKSEAVAFTSVTADGTAATTATTALTITLDKAVPGLAAEDITIGGTPGAVTKGTLTSAAGVYTLTVTPTTAGEITVTIAKDGFKFTPASLPVTVHMAP